MQGLGFRVIRVLGLGFTVSVGLTVSRVHHMRISEARALESSLEGLLA